MENTSNTLSLYNALYKGICNVHCTALYLFRR